MPKWIQRLCLEADERRTSVTSPWPPKRRTCCRSGACTAFRSGATPRAASADIVATAQKECSELSCTAAAGLHPRRFLPPIRSFAQHTNATERRPNRRPQHSGEPAPPPYHASSAVPVAPDAVLVPEQGQRRAARRLNHFRLRGERGAGERAEEEAQGSLDARPSPAWTRATIPAIARSFDLEVTPWTDPTYLLHLICRPSAGRCGAAPEQLYNDDCIRIVNVVRLPL